MTYFVFIYNHFAHTKDKLCICGSGNTCIHPVLCIWILILSFRCFQHYTTHTSKKYQYKMTPTRYFPLINVFHFVSVKFGTGWILITLYTRIYILGKQMFSFVLIDHNLSNKKCAFVGHATHVHPSCSVHFGLRLLHKMG